MRQIGIWTIARKWQTARLDIGFSKDIVSLYTVTRFILKMIREVT